MLRKIMSFHRNQAGYTLIEMLAVVVITGIIGLGAAIANAQVMTQTGKNNDYTTANRQVLNAIYWMSLDAQMMQSEPAGWATFPGTSLIFSYLTWDNDAIQVEYSVDNGTLRRSYTVNGGTPQEFLIAQYLNDDASSTNCTWDDASGELTLNITGSVGAGSHIINVTKQKTITSRPLMK